MKRILITIAIIILLSMSTAQACISIPEATLLNDPSCNEVIIYTPRDSGDNGIFNSMTVLVDGINLTNSELLSMIENAPSKWDMRDGFGGLCTSGLNCLKYGYCNLSVCELYQCISGEPICNQQGSCIIRQCENVDLLKDLSFITESPLYTNETEARNDIENFLSEYNLEAEDYWVNYRPNITADLQQYKNYSYCLETRLLFSYDILCDGVPTAYVANLSVGEEPDTSVCGNKTVTLLTNTRSIGVYTKNFSLSDEEITIIADFLSNGYSVIQQTTEEYQVFLENAERVNNDLSTCGYYHAVAHEGDWTGYVYNTESDKTLACAQAPRAGCAGGFFNEFLNELPPIKATTQILAFMLNYWWVISIIAIAIIIIALKITKKI